MNLEISTSYPFVIILIMAIVTLATRWGGVLIMSYIPIGDRVQRFINAMSGSVLVALLAPIALEGDNGARLALLTTAVLMLVVKKPMVSISAGILAAALFRQSFI
ncbi:AzlD family protein [Acinetobacter pullicarnis]|uniref:AzlD family protein n=1 Tax=Acinetobacter pullicarnis TaxID=2576829 RepID=UPI001121A2F0|nr:AzlD domain-containing protein [Acinetobacter pullicarnis]